MSYIICPIIFKNLDIQTEIIYLFIYFKNLINIFKNVHSIVNSTIAKIIR